MMIFIVCSNIRSAIIIPWSIYSGTCPKTQHLFILLLLLLQLYIANCFDLEIGAIV